MEMEYSYSDIRCGWDYYKVRKYLIEKDLFAKYILYSDKALVNIYALDSHLLFHS